MVGHASDKLHDVLRRTFTVDPSPELLQFLHRNHIDLRQVEAKAGFINIVMGRINGNDPDALTFEVGSEGYPIVALGCTAISNGQEQIVDLVAWNLNAPDYPATYCGPDGGADLLGIINCQCRGSGPLAIHKTPLQWLQAGCDGVVPLNRQWAGHWLNKASGPFVVEDIEHGREIRALLGRHASAHEILIRNPEQRQAA